MKNIRPYNTLYVELCIQSCTYFLIIYNQGMTIIQRSRTALEYDKILAELSNYTKLEQSKQLCLELTPLVRYEDIETALIYTREAKSVLDFAHDIPIEKIQSFSKLKTKNEYFIEEELIDIAKSLRTFRLVRNFIKENLAQDTLIAKLAENLYSNKNLCMNVHSSSICNRQKVETTQMSINR
jgi:dsDNA-specific endonuclease/ATPase MutS2